MVGVPCECPAKTYTYLFLRTYGPFFYSPSAFPWSLGGLGFRSAPRSFFGSTCSGCRFKTSSASFFFFFFSFRVAFSLCVQSLLFVVCCVWLCSSISLALNRVARHVRKKEKLQNDQNIPYMREFKSQTSFTFLACLLMTKLCCGCFPCVLRATSK